MPLIFYFLCRSNKDQSALCTQHSEHVCPCAWGVHRWTAHHNVWQVGESKPSNAWNKPSSCLTGLFFYVASQMSRLCSCAGGIWRGDARPGSGRSVHVHPPQPWFSCSHASRHNAVCGQVQPLQQSTSTQHFTNKWSFITHPSCIIHPRALIQCFTFYQVGI